MKKLQELKDSINNNIIKNTIITKTINNKNNKLNETDNQTITDITNWIIDLYNKALKKGVDDAETDTFYIVISPNVEKLDTFKLERDIKNIIYSYYRYVKRLGRQLHKKKEQQTIKYIGIAEQGRNQTNTHFNLVINLNRYTDPQFIIYLTSKLKEKYNKLSFNNSGINEPGQKLKTEQDIIQTLGYSAKEISYNSNNLIFTHLNHQNTIKEANEHN